MAGIAFTRHGYARCSIRRRSISGTSSVFGSALDRPGPLIVIAGLSVAPAFFKRKAVDLLDRRQAARTGRFRQALRVRNRSDSFRLRLGWHRQKCSFFGAQPTRKIRQDRAHRRVAYWSRRLARRLALR